MSDDQKQRDIDFLLEFREFKGVVNTKLDRALSDIQDLKDGTSLKIADHERRLERLEKQIDRNYTYSKLVIALGILLLGLLIWHITGYHI